jgi:hypothetical protein
MRLLPIVCACLLAAGATGAVHAQGAGPQSFFSASPVFEEADLESGGDLSVTGLILRMGTGTSFGAGHRAGITLNYDYFDYSFDNAKAFDNQGPWGVIQRYGASAPFTFALQDGWSLGVAPSVDWFRESGADSNEALVWGATMTAIRRFDNGNFIGVGLAAFSGIEDNSAFPFPIFGWQLAPRWRLINPLPAGPTGPAGVELDYDFGGGWTFGAGLAYRKSRFRLSETGPTPNGVGEISGIPVFLRARLALGQGGALNLYGGVVTGGELRVENATGNLLRKDDLETAPIIGANLSLRF